MSDFGRRYVFDLEARLQDAESERDRLREELITSGNDKEYQEQHWRAELARLREALTTTREQLRDQRIDLALITIRNALKEPNAGLAEIERIRRNRQETD